MKWFWGIALVIDLMTLGACLSHDDVAGRYLLQRVLWCCVCAVMLWNALDGVKAPWSK